MIHGPADQMSEQQRYYRPDLGLLGDNEVYNMAMALFWNVVSWVMSFLPSFLRWSPQAASGENRAVEITGPGGLDRLKLRTLVANEVTCGYNLPTHRPPYASVEGGVPKDTVVIANKYFSVNYADGEAYLSCSRAVVLSCFPVINRMNDAFVNSHCVTVCVPSFSLPSAFFLPSFCLPVAAYVFSQ